MRVSVIPVDKVIIIDGDGIVVDNWNFDDDHIHAIQWMHDKGHIELKTTDPNIEIDDISFVQPYIDKYMEIIPILKEKALKKKEEERLRIQKEEEEIKKHEEQRRKEQEQIKLLQEQNKKIRQEKLKLEEEKSQILEEINNKSRFIDLELERKELEKIHELNSLEKKLSEEELSRIDHKIFGKYQNIQNELVEKENAIKKETEKILEQLNLREKNIELHQKELDEREKALKEKIELERKEIENLRYELIARRNDLYTEFEYRADVLNLLKEKVELESKRVEETKKHDSEKFEYDQMMTKLRKEELEKKELEFENAKNILDLNSKYLEIIDEGEHRKHLAFENISKEIEDLNKKIELSSKENLNNLDQEEVSIEKLEEILSELDPEKVYTTLTSGEIKDNNFPVEKAVVWFSALKKVMENN